MTPKEKAKELFDKYATYADRDWETTSFTS